MRTNDEQIPHYVCFPRSLQVELKTKNGTNLDPGLQRLSVFDLERFFDIAQVDLGAAHNDADERLVVRSNAGHGVVQTLGEEVNLRLAALD